MNRTILVGILILVLSCKSTDLKSEAEFPVVDESVNLYAFIGEKISITEFDPNENPIRIEIDSVTGDTLRFKSFVMDNAFNNRYKVVKNIFNKLETDTVDFVAYDHYGRPGFEDVKDVLLYLSWNEEKGHYYHQKYQFDSVVKNDKGTWTGSNGESIQELFSKKKDGVLTARGIFDK
ncbi:hypothetical protein [Salegentibacter salarius]|uniref:Lipoprotein n=1 Tax=Salegentibacter salarius TaxID=435906 RepID=A0A2N0TPD7_9FLAO|nr:hypothetical protein [Salegentibacter salarius]OEY71719.1 hypothetical protein BHS39_15075 [Salegentibacter salarius]PKD16605.1 hypothetical protein APR40_15045 [Salegentibacter salarius]SLJ89795.1 hypothetical protein SAMN05660445_00872 [Salegentibacter salarius]